MHLKLAQELKNNSGFVPNMLRSTAYLFRCVSDTTYMCSALSTDLRNP